MRARVHWEARHNKGHIEWEVLGTPFAAWVEDVGATRSAGDGFLIGPKDAIPLRSITRIEKLED